MKDCKIMCLRGIKYEFVEGQIYYIRNNILQGEYIVGLCNTQYNVSKCNSIKDINDVCSGEFALLGNQSIKSILKPCMVVRLRCGELCIVVNYKKGLSLLSINGFVYTGIETFNDDLKRKYNDELFDIIEVYGLNEHGINAMDISTENRDLLFKREEQSPRDIKIKELQDKMDSIKREMEELK